MDRRTSNADPSAVEDPQHAAASGMATAVDDDGAAAATGGDQHQVAGENGGDNGGDAYGNGDVAMAGEEANAADAGNVEGGDGAFEHYEDVGGAGAFEDGDGGALVGHGDGEGGLHDDGHGDGAGGIGIDPIAEAIKALPATLIQYGEPLVFDEDDNGDIIEGDGNSTTVNASSVVATGGASATTGAGGKVPRHPLLPVFRQQSLVLSETPVVTSTERVLHAVLPPREFSIPVEFGPDGRPTRRKRLVQPVNSIDATRQQLAELREVLDFKLKDAKARASGLCPVRRAIFTMLFDELLRQVTIDCAERGLLLLRIRDQLRMSYDAQTALYESSLHETRRRIFEATKSRPELMVQVEQLTGETDALRKEVRRLEAQHVALLRAADEQAQADSKKHGEELLFLERTKQRLQQHIERVKELFEEERRKMRGEAA